jgi:hypothetical protein
MIKIIHRINTKNLLKNTSNNYGVEIDIRSNNGKLILNHDPYKDGEDLSEWLSYYNHKFLILNIKEEGIEEDIIRLMKENSISNYFLLDLSFPSIIRLRSKEKNIAVRLSHFESFETVEKFKNEVNWIWIDMINDSIPFSKSNYNVIQECGFKTCIVSPELWGRPISLIERLKSQLIDNNYKIDAVCTKEPAIWEE